MTVSREGGIGCARKGAAIYEFMGSPNLKVKAFDFF